MVEASENNKRIAKNTVMLYFRMLILMCVSLYTSRIVLQTLGETDYGLYSVVGGIVVLLSFLNNAMSSATQRFLNFEMGKKNAEGLRFVFSSAVFIHAIVAVVVLLLAETLGLWFLGTCMNIPPDRVVAAHWVYQFSVAAFMVNILSVPYNAAIIAHEKMSAFAYISILDACLRLLLVYLVQVLLFDKLIVYGFLMFLVGGLLRLVYGVYCRRHFDEARFSRNYIDKALARKMMSFSSWTVFGTLGHILHTQGIAICVNLFFSPAVNAALGISNVVNTKVNGFVSNFQVALNPQIVKNYAVGNLEEMHKLIFRGCRFSFFLISFFAIPLIVEAPAILDFWLGKAPEYTVIFVRIVLLIAIVNCYSGILANSQGATGKIKTYQLTLTTVGAFHVPFALVAFYLGAPPYASSWIYLAIVFLLQLIRVCFVSRSVGMSAMKFCRSVVWPCVLVLVLASVVPVILHFCWHGGFLVLVAKCAASFACTSLIAFTLGMEAGERKMVIGIFKKKILRQNDR